jgi:phosphoglycerate dehydrogenase-like enzyme
MSAPRIAIGPDLAPFATEAVVSGGGSIVAIEDRPDGLVWLNPFDLAGLSEHLATAPGLRWVQLPFAGVEGPAASGILDEDRVWTCAKGAYAEPVAEHALALTLAGLRHLRRRAEARSWGSPAGTSLYDQQVTILGGGGITTSLLQQLAPFRAVTVDVSALHEALAGSLVVVVALALTPETEGIIGEAELAIMGERALLVNVARGRHVDTDALVTALGAGVIAGASLDVTNPEPLPDGHPLWSEPNCLITPHTADTIEMIRPLLAERIRINVQRLASGEPLVGVVDAKAGY